MSKHLLILGAGLTGVPIAHYALKHYADKHDLKITLVSPSNDFYWNIGSPRAAIPGQLSDDKVIYSIPDAFAQYPSARFEFVQGSVQKWDADQSSVLVTLEKSREQVINYDTLVVATGASSGQMPWKLVGSAGGTASALAKLRDDVAKASSIVIGGSGPTGVEFASELGYEFGKRGKSENKKITLIMRDNLPLAPWLKTSTRLGVEKELEKLNVELIKEASIVNTSTNARGKTVVEFTKADGSDNTLEADLFVPTWGLKPNTIFAPSSLREDNGHLKVTETLQAPGYDNVFILGEASTLSCDGAMIREKQIRHVAKALGQVFAGQEVADFVPLNTVAFSVSTGRDRGVGEVYGWSMPSLMVWYFKGRDMCTGQAGHYVAGKKLILGAL
jgi:NADH dehydrogenase FAD-containing subunit